MRFKITDAHLFQVSVENRMAQSLPRKIEWVECVTIAYETCSTLQISQDPPQQQLATLWG